MKHTSEIVLVVKTINETKELKYDVIEFPKVFGGTGKTWMCILSSRGSFEEGITKFSSDTECGWMLVSFGPGDFSMGSLYFFNDHFVKMPKHDPFKVSNTNRFNVRFGSSSQYSFNLAWSWFDLPNIIPERTLAIWKEFFVKGCPDDFDSSDLNKKGVYFVRELNDGVKY